MNFLKGIYNFVKQIVVGLYQHTVGDLVRLAKHTVSGTIDREVDGRAMGRVIMLAFLALMTFVFPGSIIMLSIARSLVAMDVVGAIALTCFDMADYYDVDSGSVAPQAA